MNNFDTSTWKEFKIGDVLDIRSSNGIFHANALNISEQPFEGSHPYVVRSSKNNGIRGYIKENKISETGARMLKFQEQLADEYKYKPIPRTFFKDVRAEFEETLPEWCNMSGDTTKLETRSGTVIASGYNRIVIGDYGAFVEFSRAQANARHLKIKEGQSYRIEDQRYAEHVKYLWLTADDDSDVKVYDQKRSVEYADYKPGMLYVSVYEVFPAETDAGLS